METQTHFNLTNALENWRRELSAQSQLTADQRRELENHLRDSLAALQNRGLSDEEAFWLARRRVGQPAQLAEEFLKADPAKIWRDRILWMAISLVGSYVFMTWKDLFGTWVTENYTWDEALYLIPVVALIAGVVLLRRGNLPDSQRLENIAPWKLAFGLFAILLTTVLCAYGRSHHLPGGDNMIGVGYNLGMVLSWYGNAVWPFVTVLILLFTLKPKSKTGHTA